MSARAGWILSVILVVAAIGIAPVAIGDRAHAQPDLAIEQRESAIDQRTVAIETQDSAIVQQDEIDADEVRIDIALRADGSAEWTIEFWVRLDDNESEAAYKSLADDIEADPDNHTSQFAERIDDTVATASEATGREMSADGFTVETRTQSLARDYGVISYEFTWDGFAAVEDEQIRAGDAIEGIYLDDGTRLLISWPEGYELESAAPEADDERERSIIWRGGETDFVSGEPRVVVSPAGWGVSTILLLGGGLLVVGLIAVGAWRYRERRKAAESTGETIEYSSKESDSGSADAGETGSAPASEGASAKASPSGSDVEPGPPDDLLSNEEQVLRLVRERGGRIKQQTVVDELGWTDAKTSKVVSGLREEGELESFRLGRENVLSLPETDDGVLSGDSSLSETDEGSSEPPN